MFIHFKLVFASATPVSAKDKLHVVMLQRHERKAWCEITIGAYLINFNQIPAIISQQKRDIDPKLMLVQDIRPTLGHILSLVSTTIIVNLPHADCGNLR